MFATGPPCLRVGCSPRSVASASSSARHILRTESLRKMRGINSSSSRELKDDDDDIPASHKMYLEVCGRRTGFGPTHSPAPQFPTKTHIPRPPNFHTTRDSHIPTYPCTPFSQQPTTLTPVPHILSLPAVRSACPDSSSFHPPFLCIQRQLHFSLLASQTDARVVTG